MFDTNPKVQEICRQLREAENDYDYNQMDLQEAYKFGASGDEIKRLIAREAKLRAEIYRLQHRRDTFYD